MGNFPESAEVQATVAEEDVPKDDISWATILSRTKLGPHRRHFFQLQDVKGNVFTHVRVTIFPDGGVKRIRVMGSRADPRSVAPVIIPQTAKIPSKPIPAAARSHGEVTIGQDQVFVRALPLSHEGFVEFGSVIQAYEDVNAAPRHVTVTEANQGTAMKFSHVSAKVQASFPTMDSAMPAPNFAVYRAQPIPANPTFAVKLLERHPHNNQAFFVIGSGSKLWDNDLEQLSNGYLVVVAKNGANDRPDIATLRAFMASSSQGVLYNAGTWHHPLIALNTATDFACVETQLGGGNKLDCEVVDLEPPHVLVGVPKF